MFNGEQKAALRMKNCAREEKKKGTRWFEI